MEAERAEEMKRRFHEYRTSGAFSTKKIFLFGHCEATLKLADLFLAQGLLPSAILDNSKQKHRIQYKDIAVLPPESILEVPSSDAVVCIASRFYEEMNAQLRTLGFTGSIYKIVDYNSFAEYSLSEDTIRRKTERAERGKERLSQLKRKVSGDFYVFCPFQALGDVYLAMSYLPEFLKKKNKCHAVVCVVGAACGSTARLFAGTTVVVMNQVEMDETVQGVIYTMDVDCFIAHQDRPYVVKLHNALYTKCIPLETIYRCGIFGLAPDTSPVEPVNWAPFHGFGTAQKDRSVILSPYAKSVPAFPTAFWEQAIDILSRKGYSIFTNVVEGEETLPGISALSLSIEELKSAAEQAGCFIGIRSGLCDILRTASCRKIALYPDYYYSDTRWKAINMYSIPGFENIAVTGGFSWTIL